MVRRIAHIDLDSFFVSVERIKDPSLAGKPVIVGGSSERGVVSSCSYEARKYGVHSAMPTFKAAKLCPHAVFAKGDMRSYSHYSRVVTDIILNRVPVVEKASIDEFYLDLTGMDKYFGAFETMADLKQEINDKTGLPISFAPATNKLISKIATNEAKPNGQIEIPPGTERAYLAPLPIGKIPGVGEKTVEILNKRGIFTVQQVAEIEVDQLEILLGKWGTEMHRKAQGIDESPVVPYHEQKSISSEETFAADTNDIAFLEHELVRLAEKIGFELRQEGKLAGTVAIKLRYSNFETLTRQTTIDYTGADAIFIRKAKELFRQTYDTKRPARLIGVKLSNLVEDTLQLSLFENVTEDRNLYTAIDDIKRSFGKSVIMRAGGMTQESDKQLKNNDPLWLSRNAPKPTDD
jgi:DNA polymerase-4